MVKSPLTTALMALVAGGGVFTAPLTVAQDANAVDVHAQETARRRAAMKDALILVSQAREAYQAKRYTDAVEHYRNALSVLPQAPATEKLHKFICESLSDALIARAIDYRSVGRTDEAVQFLREALQLDPQNERAQKELVYSLDPARNNPALSPEHVGDVEEVSRLLSLANGYLDLGKYDEAIAAFEAVSQYDPYNVAAKRGIERANRKRQEYYSAAYSTRRAEMLGEVDAQWDNALKAIAAPMRVMSDSAASAETFDGMEDGVENAHADALEKMQVSDFALEDNSIDEAIDVIRGFIKRFEANGVRSSRPIDIVARLGENGSTGYQKAASSRNSIHLTEVSMKEVLDEVSRLYDVDYYFTPLGVEFVKSGEDYARMIQTTFVVPPQFFDNKEEDEDDSEDSAFAAPGRMSVSRRNPVKTLKGMGINFPKGANAVYHPSTRRLAVRNTKRNIDAIRELVEGANDSNERVVVMDVITIEMSDTHLEDLGFDWLFNMHLGGELYTGGGVSRVVSGITGLPTLSSAGGPSVQNQGNAVTTGLRSIRQVSGSGAMNRLIEEGSASNFNSSNSMASPSIFGVRGVWSAADVTVMMRGLSQQKGVDVLQAPRLVFDANNEEQVSIVNVREIFYPSNYDPPQIPQNTSVRNDSPNYQDDEEEYYDNEYGGGGGGSMVVSGAHPSEFERYGYSEEGASGIGGIIQIHRSQMEPGRNSVNLTLTTTVNEFDGFIDWGSPIYSVLMTSSLLGQGGEIRRLNMSDNHIYQPIFRRRVVNTAVSVENGSVLVIGGMKEARVVKYDDKVPVLGDLPLVGRLFRSSGEDTEKRVLLVFAKVNIVDPTGRNINGSEEDSSAPAPM